MSTHFHKLARKDNGVSAVVGTILMVAVTVIIGATVYAAVNAYGSKGVKENTNVAFKAVGIDSDGNGKLDTIKVTYLTGPKGMALSDVSISLNWATNSTLSNVAPSTQHNPAGSWNPGDFVQYARPGVSGTGGSFLVTVAVQGNQVIDTQVTLDE